ncbi:MAG: tetratricopeptide repeat protein, partial [Hyphomicrobium sp.]
AEEWQRSLKIGGELWRLLEGHPGQVGAEHLCAATGDLGTFLRQFEGGAERLPWLAWLPENDCATEVRARLEELREREPYSFVREVFLVQLGLRDGRLRATLRAAENLRLEDAERPSLLVLKGLAELGLERMALARATFRSLKEVVPASATAQLLVAMTYGRDDERQTQKTQLEEAFSIEPDHFATRLALARLAAENGDFADAEGHIGALVQIDPEDPSVVELQALLALVRGDDAAAVSNLERALEIAPNGVRALKLAIVHDRLGNGADAAATLERWLSVHPTDVDVRLALANRYLSSDQVEEARSHYRKVRLLAPKNFVALNNLAWTEVLLGNPKVALTPAQQAYRLAPDDPRVLDTYGYALAEAGDLEKAVELLQRAVTRAPQDAQTQYHLAHALTKRGDREEAKGILERILAEPTVFRGREDAKALLQQLQG